MQNADWRSCLPQSRLAQIRSLNRPEERAASLAAGYLLYRYLGVSSDDDLVISSYGKPSLAAGFPYFNISHSEQYTVLAVADTEVGIDTEPEDVADRLSELPKKAFSEEELHWLDDHSDLTSFALMWTRKEAVLKADGRGFWTDPAGISVLTQKRFSVQSVFANGQVISCAIAGLSQQESDFMEMKVIS